MASRLPLIAILAAASAAVLLWSLRPASGPAAPTVTARGTALVAPTPAVAPPPVASPAEPAAAVPPGAGSADGPPPGLSAAQWATVEAGLAGHPQAAAERSRLRAYFAWSDAVQRWRGARHDAALARQVDAGLPGRVALAEVSVPEARVLKAALLQTLVPDEAGRIAALQAFDATLPRSAGPDAREREFLQRQSALVAAWQAQPAAQRDPAALQRQLETLRRTQFSKETTR